MVDRQQFVREAEFLQFLFGCSPGSGNNIPCHVIYRFL
jgi:hypothetical protein